MKFLKIVLAATALVLSSSVNAALISTDLNVVGDGLVTLDTDTGLRWLDLSITDNQTYVDALASNPAWSYATNSQVESLFATLFPGYVETSANHLSVHDNITDTQYQQVINFSNLFGFTGTYNGGLYSGGLYSDEDGILRMMGSLHDSSRTIVYGDEFRSNFEYSRSTSGNSNFGVYLVQTSVVPVPAAAWLFGSGLIGLAGYARRKKA